MVGPTLAVYMSEEMGLMGVTQTEGKETRKELTGVARGEERD